MFKGSQYHTFTIHCGHLSFLATRIGFNESSVYVSEGQGSITLSLSITRSLSTDMTVMIFTTDETANGELNFIQAHSYCSFYLLPHS